MTTTKRVGEQSTSRTRSQNKGWRIAWNCQESRRFCPVRIEVHQQFHKEDRYDRAKGYPFHAKPVTILSTFDGTVNAIIDAKANETDEGQKTSSFELLHTQCWRQWRQHPCYLHLRGQVWWWSKDIRTLERKSHPKSVLNHGSRLQTETSYHVIVTNFREKLTEVCKNMLIAIIEGTKKCVVQGTGDENN